MSVLAVALEVFDELPKTTLCSHEILDELPRFWREQRSLLRLHAARNRRSLARELLPVRWRLERRALSPGRRLE